MKKHIIIYTILFIFAPMMCTMATEFAVNSHRANPYNRYKFRVKWDGKYVPGIIRVSGLHRETQIITYKSGNDKKGTAQQVPGSTTLKPIILERGRTHDTAFESWATKVWNMNQTGAQADYKKNIIIELLNEAGQVVMAFQVYNCWPSQYSPLTELDANSDDIAIESMLLQHTGWERDMAVTEPSEPSFTVP